VRFRRAGNFEDFLAHPVGLDLHETRLASATVMNCVKLRAEGPES
jgi:hypothetical protein